MMEVLKGPFIFLHGFSEPEKEGEIETALKKTNGVRNLFFITEDTPDSNAELPQDSIHINIERLFLKIYREKKLGASKFETFMSEEDRLSAVQVCVAQWNKQEKDTFDADTSVVLWTSRKLKQEKLRIATEEANLVLSKDAQSATNDKLVTSCKTPSRTSQLSPSFRTPKTPYFGNDSPHVIHTILEMYNSFLRQCNKVDSEDVLQKVKGHFRSKDFDGDSWHTSKGNVFVFKDLPEAKTKIEMLKALVGDCSIICISSPTMTTPTTLEGTALSDGTLSFLYKELNLAQLLSMSIDTSHSFSQPKAPQSASEVFCRKLFFSYIALLVNTRDELALAKCLCLPDRGLGQEGFCALKRTARQKGIPMFQTAVSFVMQIRLGGKSYAPDTDSPLTPHVKALSEFVNIVQRLQTIVEEVSDTRQAVEKVITNLKITLIKTKDCALRKSSIQNVASQLLNEIRNNCTNTHIVCPLTSPKEVCNGGSVLGQGAIKVLTYLLDVESARSWNAVSPADVLTDQCSSQSTPVRFPSMLSQFRSPEVRACSPHDVSLRERLMPKKRKFPQGARSCMEWALPAVVSTPEFKAPRPSPEANDDDIFHHISSQKINLWAASPEDRTLARQAFRENRVANDPSTPVSEDSRVARVGHSTTPKGRKVSEVGKSFECPEEGSQDKKDSSELIKMQSSSKNKPLKRKKLLLEGESGTMKSARNTRTAPKKKAQPLVKGQKTLSSFFRT